MIAGRIAVTIASVISTRPMFTRRQAARARGRRTQAHARPPRAADRGRGRRPGFGFDNWYACSCRRTDKAIANRFRSVARILLERKPRKMLLGQGLDVAATTQDEFAKMYSGDCNVAKVVKASACAELTA